MKKILLIAAALVVVGAGAAYAGGVQAAWNACDGTAGAAQFLTFDCTQGAGTEYDLYHTFTLDTSYPGVIAAQAIVTLTFSDAATGTPIAVPGFWQMSTGGCNDGSVAMTYLRVAATCASGTGILCGNNLNFCSGSGVGGESVGFGGFNKIRMLVLLARASTSPVTLTAAKHFAWDIQFFIDSPTACLDGCSSAKAQITIDQLDIFDNINGTRSVTSADPGSTPTACANTAVCDVIPVQAKTWGQLKALYR